MIKEVSKLISTLTEINFKEYIKEYTKSKYKTTQVRIIDGPYDGGNDLEIILTNENGRRMSSTWLRALLGFHTLSLSVEPLSDPCFLCPPIPYRIHSSINAEKGASEHLYPYTQYTTWRHFNWKV